MPGREIASRSGLISAAGKCSIGRCWRSPTRMPTRASATTRRWSAPYATARSPPRPASRPAVPESLIDAEPGDAPKLTRSAKHVLAKPLTARRAARLIAEFTLVATLAGGTLGWLIDRKDFPSLGDGLWWALQTVTTVGYGDVTPTHVEGRVIAAVVMLAGIGFLAVITASITATFVEQARKRLVVDEKRELEQIASELQSISARLDGLEAAGGAERSSGGA